MDLDNLVFRTDTRQLEDALQKVNELSTATSKFSVDSVKASRDIAKANEQRVRAEEKLAVAEAKREETLERLKQKQTELNNALAKIPDISKPLDNAGGSASRTEAYIEKLVNGIKIYRAETIDVSGQTIELGNSFTRSQANVLAYQMQIGATTDQLKLIAQQFKDINAFSNTNPFDKSTRGLTSLRQEITELQMVDKFMRDGVALTREQIVNLSKDSERLTQAYNSMGKSQEELTSELARLKTQTIEAAKQKNILTEAARQSEIQARKEADALIEQSRAIKLVNDAMMKEWANKQDSKDPVLADMASFYKQQGIEADALAAKVAKLENAEAKLAFTNKELAAGLTTASANALFAYKKGLEEIGTSSEQVTEKMKAFREQLVIKQSYSPIQKIADDTEEVNKRLDHLSRALGPQITDIFVGLATGQSLLTVALQQGGQIRDQVALAGVESSKMGKALTDSMIMMVGSLKDVGAAMGQLFVGAIMKLGEGLAGLTMKVSGTTSSMDKLAEKFPAIAKATTFLMGVLGSLGIAFAGALVVTTIKATVEQENLSRALTLTGASLGISTQQALEYSKSMKDLGVTQTDAIKVISEMAKVGGFTKDQINLVTEAAVGLNKYGGVAIEDTVKKFSEVGKEPVKALIEYGRQTGLVTVEQIKHIRALDETGKKTQAVNEAMAIMGGASKEAIQRLKDESGSLMRFWISIVGLVKEFKDFLMNIGRTAIDDDSYARQVKEVERLNKAVSATGAQSYIFQYVKAVEELAKMERMRGRNNEEYVETTKNNSDAVAEYGRNLDDLKKKEDEAKKTAEELRKQREKDKETYDDLMNVYSGYTKTYNDQQESLKRSLANKAISPEQFKQAMFALEQLQPYFKKSEDAFAAYNAEIEKHDQVIKSLQDTNQAEASALEHRASLLGKTAEEQRRLTIEYEKNQKLLKLQVQYQKELDALEKRGFDGEYGKQKRRELDQAFTDARVLIEQDANLKIREDYVNKFQEVQKDISNIITTALLDGGKEGADSLKNYLKTKFRNFVIDVFINPIVGQFLGSITGGSAGAAVGAQSGLGGLMNTFSTVSGLSNALSGFSSTAATLGSSITSLGSLVGSGALTSFGVGMQGSTLAAGLAGPTTAGATGAMGAGASFGAAVPWIAGAFAIDQILLGGKVTGAISKALGLGGDEKPKYKFQTGGGDFEDKISVEGVFGAIGMSDFSKNISAGEYKDTFQAIADLDAAIAATLTKEQNEQIKKALDNFVSKRDESVENYLASRMKVMADVIGGGLNELIDEFEGNSADLIKYFTQLTQLKPTLKAFESLGLVLGNTEKETLALASSLELLAGGQESLIASLNYFYENFFNSSEKIQLQTDSLTKTFDELGLTLPATKAEFRALLEGALSSGDLGLSASLFALMQPFNDFIAMTDEVSEAMQDLTNNLLDEINRLRGAIISDSGISGNVSGLTAEFAILSAQARAGNVTALEKLPEYSQAIEQAVAASAVNASDVAYARAWLAESLGSTTNVLAGVEPDTTVGSFTQDVATPSTVNGASVLTASTSSQAELIAALVAEVQGLRAEVRADVAANNKTAKILERANQDGESLSVSIVS